MNLRQFSVAVMFMALGALGFAGNAILQTPANIMVNDDDQTSTVDCRGGAVTVNGDDNRLTLNGECSKLTVNGDDNAINARTVTEILVLGDDNNIVVETVARINTIGDDNSVAWKSGAGGKPPEISNTGDDNKTGQVR